MPNERTVAEAASYTVTVADEATWSGMTAEQFAQAYSGKPEDDPAASMRMAMEMQARMMQAMREGKSAEEMQAEMLKQTTGIATELPIGEYFDKELYGAPMFVVLEETALQKPARFVVVFEDRALKRTGFVLHLPPAMLTGLTPGPTEAAPEAPKPFQPRKRPR